MVWFSSELPPQFGPVVQSVAHLTEQLEVLGSKLETDHDIFSTVIIPPSTDSRKAVRRTKPAQEL